MTVDLSTFDGYVTIDGYPSPGEHRTVRIKTEEWDGETKRVARLVTGPKRRWDDLQGFAFVGDSGSIRVWRKYSDSDRYTNIAWALNHQNACERLRGIEFRIEKRCRACFRKLTNPKSLDRGFGPVCWKKRRQR